MGVQHSAERPRAGQLDAGDQDGRRSEEHEDAPAHRDSARHDVDAASEAAQAEDEARAPSPSGLPSVSAWRCGHGDRLEDRLLRAIKRVSARNARDELQRSGAFAELNAGCDSEGTAVLIGGPDAFDWSTAAKAFFLRNKWTAGLLHQLVSLLKPGRLRNLLGWLACELTGHPVDVATGRLLTRAQDFEIRGPIPLKFERYYSSAWAERDSPLGYGWSHTFDERIWVERGKVVYKAGDGREIEFHTHDLPERRMKPGHELFYAIDRLTLRCLDNGQWTLRTTDGLTREFSMLPGNSHVSRLTKIRNRFSQWVAFEYDPLGQLDGVRTSEGGWARFEHSRGRLHRIALPYPYGDAAGWYDQVSFTYSQGGDLIAATDSQRHMRTYRYESHLLVQETDRDGVTFYFEYDGRDSTASCIRTWGNDGNSTDRLFFREITYDKKNRRTFVEDSLGKTTTYEMNVANAVMKIVDPHGEASTAEYDSHLWKTAATDALGGRTIWEYDSWGRETKRVLPNGATTIKSYDANGELAELVDALNVRWVCSYDSRGRLVQVVNSAGNAAWFAYGTGAEPIKTTYADNAVTSYELDEGGRPTRIVFPNGAVEERWYDRAGQVVKIRDAEGRAHHLDYDLEGRTIEIQFPGGGKRRFEYTPEGDLRLDQGPLRVIQYGYAGYHALAWSEEAGERTQLHHDSEGQLVALINEDGEAFAYERDACGFVQADTSFEGRRRTYVRDALGRVVQEFSPIGIGTQFFYDVMSNVTRVRYPDGTENTFSYDLVGQLETATNAVGTVRIERDSRGRSTTERFGDDWVASSLDSFGRRIEVASSRGLTQRVRRNVVGDSSAVSIWGSDQLGQAHPIWGVGFERNLHGVEVSRTMPGSVMARRSLDAAGRPSATATWRGHELLDRTEYEWAAAERLVGKKSTVWGDVTYTHDARGRLSASQSADGLALARAPSRTGNLFKRSDRMDRRYGKGGVLLQDGETTYGYDAAGNVIFKRLPDETEWLYEWNASGCLMKVTTPEGRSVRFGYDALGRRVSKTTDRGTTHWLWDGDVPVHEWTDNPDVPGVTTWIFEPESFAPLGKVDGDGRCYSILSDYLGTPTEMFDEAGLLAWQAQLDLYGVPTVAVGKQAACPWRWAGQYEDDETGLYYNRFRYYDPERGNYLSPDPIDLAGGISRYGYVQDPFGWVDPLGLAGQFASGKGPHTALVEIFDALGNLRESGVITSGNMTAAEAALKFPRSSLATHTENRAARGSVLAAGETMIITGQYRPCPSCKGAMNKASRESGATIKYRWKDDAGENEWQANQKKKCS